MGRLIVIFALLFSLYATRHGWMPAHSLSAEELQIVLAAEPEQTKPEDDSVIFWTWSDSTVQITPLFDYRMVARVMGTKRYRFDREARYSPLDLLVTWGPAADPALDDYVDWSQSARFGFFEYQALPPGIDNQTIGVHMANTHLIPADDDVADRMGDIHRGDLVEIEGMLVTLREEWDDGRWYAWTSSTTREDTGAGACEVILVQNVRINGA
ncbi:MAG: hypothetical protein AAF772_04690 [Acidobacteriota bacterium]